MKVRYIVQARMSSTRLPGKVIMEIGGRPLIGHIIERLFKSGAKPEEIKFALSDEDNTRIENYLESRNISWFKGDQYNVLSRFIEISRDLDDLDIVVRLTGDNPFTDFKCLKEIVEQMKNNREIDYSYPQKLPLGMGFEVIRKKCLFHQLNFVLKLHHLEHVTTFIRENPDKFNIVPFEYFKNTGNIRLTVDYPEDLEMVRKTFNCFKEIANEYFCSEDVYDLNKKDPDFFRLNIHLEQKKPTEYEKKR